MHEAVRMAVVSMTAMAAVVMVELQGVPLFMSKHDQDIS
jgi:hypothetical protein